MIGCLKPTMRDGLEGLSPYYCRYHIQLRARHGSLWHRSYKAEELRPYLEASQNWIDSNREEIYVAHALTSLAGSMNSAGYPEIATRLKGLPASKRARIAFARLREADVKPERLLALYLAVCSLMKEDAGTHRSEEFRRVQVAKAIHRLASGYHREWEFPLPDGTTAPIVLHAYPRSSGKVLRLIGAEVEKACELVESYHLPKILLLKNELSGPHPSSLPGWKPQWRLELDAARAAAQASDTVRR